MYASLRDAGEWRFLGEKPGSMRTPPEARSSALLTVAGWAVASESGGASLQVMTYSGVRAELAADAEDVQFIDACLVEGLHCWITGMLVVLPRSSVVGCERISVWSTSADIVARLPAPVMKSIAEAARDTVLYNFMERSSIRSTGRVAARHPMVFASVMRYVEANPTAAPLFSKLEASSHYELVAASKIPVLRVEHLSPIGVTCASFCHLTDTVFLRDVLFETTSQVVAGVVLGEDTQLLVDLIAHHVELHGRGDATLVVAPRSAIPSVAASMGRAGLQPSVVWTASVAASYPGSQRPTITTPEMSTILPPYHWRRVFFVDWPASFAYGIDADCYIALGVEHEVCASATTDRRGFISRLTQLFRLTADVLQNAPTLERLLVSAVHREGPLVDMGAAVKKYAYSHPQTHGGREGSGVFLASLVEGLRRFPVTEDALRFFADRDVNAFARKSLAAPSHATCPVCFDDRPDTATRCGHWFCASCISTALRRGSACPVCKQPIRRGDVVTLGRDEPRAAITEELAWLLERLRARLDAGAKLAVFAEFAQVHEAFGASLRRAGARDVTLWRGNTMQLIKAHASFNAASAGALLADPSRLDLRWTRFDGVDEVGVIPPLGGPHDPCCRLRHIVDSCPGAKHIEVVGAGPEPCVSELPVCEFRHICPVMLRADPPPG